MFFEKTMITQRTSTEGNANFMPVEDFLAGWKKEGFTGFSMNLEPKKVNGVPTLIISDDKGNDVLVNLGKPVAQALKEGKITKKELLGMQVAAGKNQAGEPRFYLAHNGREIVTIDQAIAAAKAARALLKAKYSITDISTMLEV